MQQGSDGNRSAVFFWVVLALSAAFIAFSSAGLPATVAAHFGPGGQANAFMPQSMYRAFMLVMAVGIPVLLYLLPKLLLRMPIRLINLPHRDYWLAPQRSAESLGFLARHCAWLAPLVMLFLCYVHGLVLLANRASPPQLSQGAFLAGLLVFIASVGVWTVTLFRRFRRVP